MESLFSNVRPVPHTKPVAPYIGGKRRLADYLAAKIATTPHDTYAEPFVGMGGVFLRRTTAPRVELINDISSDVANLFRVVRWHCDALIENMRWMLNTRSEWTLLSSQPVTCLTDIQRATRFLYLQRAGFGGKVVTRTFGVSRSDPARFDVTKLRPLLQALHDRLTGVVIECLPWQEFVERYDAAETLFYLDPPYHGSERDYGAVFDVGQYGVMAEVLASIKGRFILSINDTPYVRSVFDRFTLEPVRTRYSIGAADRAESRCELIITGPVRG